MFSGSLKGAELRMNEMDKSMKELSLRYVVQSSSKAVVKLALWRSSSNAVNEVDSRACSMTGLASVQVCRVVEASCRCGQGGAASEGMSAAQVK